MKSKLLFVIVFIINTMLLGQTGRIKITLTDNNKEVIPFASIKVERDKITRLAITNLDGECTIDSLIPGNYTIKASYVGCTPLENVNVKVENRKTTHLIKQMQKGVLLDRIEIVDYHVPIITDGTTYCWSVITSCGFSCTSVIKQRAESIDSIKENLNSFKFYPNPTAGQLFVETKGNIEEFSVMDITGKSIRTYNSSAKRMEIDVSDLSSGIYFLKYFKEGAWAADRVVVVH